MSGYTAELVWERGEQVFVDTRYSRRHLIRFDGGVEMAGSSSPHSVPLPYSDSAAVDPEEAFVASISSCHLLWFLALAAKGGFCVDRYVDRPDGVLERNAAGKLAMTRVTLRPRVEFSGSRQPHREELESLHHAAHEACYIANSVKSEVRVEVPD